MPDNARERREPLRIALVDDEPLFREGARLALAAAGGFTVVGEAGDGPLGLALVERVHPDIVVLDLCLPEGDGIYVTRLVRQRCPATRVLILSVQERECDVLDAIEAGAQGYALKGGPIEDFLDALRAVGRGERYLAAGLRRDLLSAALARSRTEQRGLLAALSGRERQIFRLVVAGATNREMAAALGVSLKTVDTHRTSLNGKLGCHSTADLVRLAVVNGLLDGPPPTSEAADGYADPTRRGEPAPVAG